MFRQSISRTTSKINELVGASGCRYRFKELIQERPHVGRVWLATSDASYYSNGYVCQLTLFRFAQNQFILKEIPKDIFSAFNENIMSQLRETPHVRLPCDNVPNQRILVYKYLTDDFLSLVREQIPMQARKQVLKAVLKGITELHDRHIIHLGSRVSCLHEVKSHKLIMSRYKAR